MAKELNPDVTMSDAQKLITRIVATATVNRWDFRVDFDSGGIDIVIRIPYDADGAPTYRMPPVES